MKYTYKHTLYASYLGFVTQAVINNLPPLLFVTFQREFAVSLEQIGFLISLNFGVQLLTDLVSIKLIDRIGYRRGVVFAHVLSFTGLIAFSVLPFAFSRGYIGLLISMTFCSIGGGLLEVLLSPIVEALPGDEKASTMSLLHSFYCWGQVAVVLLSTVFFVTAGVGKWYYLPVLWSVIPFVNTIFFLKVPLRTLVEAEERQPLRQLLKQRLFWLFMLFMVCAGSSELAMSQWASLFAELGLGVSKFAGDLLGPCTFAIGMGLVRFLYGVKGSKLHLERMLVLSGILCVIGYLITVFSPIPLISLAGCTVCGVSVAMLWPGTYSLTSRHFPRGGTAMFAVLALAGDIGCSVGPGLVGFISNAVQKYASFQMLPWITDATEAGLKAGLLAVTIFPAVMLVGFSVLAGKKRTHP